MHITCPHCHRRIRIHKSRQMKCTCGHILKYEDCYGKKEGIYLLDANVFIYAQNRDPMRGEFCREVINDKYVATVETVVKEIHDIRPGMHVYKVKEISAEVKDLKTNSLKKPSEHDISLIQVAIDNPEIVGILTYDNDFGKIASAGIVKSKSGYKDNFFVGNAEEYLKKVKKR